MKNPQYEIGSIIRYSNFVGQIKRVRVTSREADIKNGRPGFDGVDLDGTDPDPEWNNVWGYDSQIVEVL